MTIPEGSPSIAAWKGGLIVSVQENAGSPLDNPGIIAALAETVAISGVVGLRMNGPENIAAARPRTRLPILGINKTYLESGRVWITPTFEMARSLAEAGADVIALDATNLPRRPGQSVTELIARIHAELGRPVMADISALEEGLAAARAGADLVGTTLSGYTCPTLASPFDPPDLDLVRQLSAAITVPVIAEGRYNTPELASQAIQAGAHAVVVGSAITRPEFITAMFLQQIQLNR